MAHYVTTLLFIITVLFHGAVVADADGPDYWQVHSVAANDTLSLRQKTDWRSKLVLKIPHNGKCLRNIECKGGLTLQEFTDLPESEKRRIRKQRPRWCLIVYKKIQGWVRAKYLREYEEVCSK